MPVGRNYRVERRGVTCRELLHVVLISKIPVGQRKLGGAANGAHTQAVAGTHKPKLISRSSGIELCDVGVARSGVVFRESVETISATEPVNFIADTTHQAVCTGTAVQGVTARTTLDLVRQLGTVECVSPVEPYIWFALPLEPVSESLPAVPLMKARLLMSASLQTTPSLDLNASIFLAAWLKYY